jgi:hypothetical protein
MAQESLTEFSTDAQTPKSTNSDNSDSPAEKLEAIREELAEVRDELGRTDDLDAEELAGAEAELKALENEAEETRKETVEPTLDDHMEVGDTLAGISRRQGHRKFIYDREEALETIEEDTEIDPLEVSKLKPKAVRDALKKAGINPKFHVGKNEYEYYRRT